MRTSGRAGCGGYSHDDLSRIASVSCGSTWGQTFSFDPFGNISKDGSNGGISFAGLYNTSTNRLTNMSNSYDSNGNLTGISSDATYSYSWDAEGKPASITRSGSTVNLTYDALGRMAEQNRGGSYTQVVYGPDGAKLALMSGSSLQRAFVPLPAGAQAVYNGSGLAYYRHADWLGTSRLASTPSRTLYYDGAYAPYGESYSETGTTDRTFTGQNQDTHSGLYDFMYREYHPVSGRWISPDPAGLAAVDLSNPQSLNRYAYVMNTPTVYVDPLGLQVARLPDPDGGGGRSGWGFGFGNCNLDGILYNCAMLAGPTGAWTTACPDNNCAGRSYTADNQIWRWVPGSASSNTANDNGGYTISVTVHDGHWQYVGSVVSILRAANNGRLPNGDVPLNPYAQAVFSHPTLQTAASTMTDARTYALWTGGSAIEGLLLVPSAGAPVSSSIYNTWLSFEYAFPGATADIIQMITPPSSIPSTLPGAVVFGGEQIYDWYRNRH